jgi:hypothetical protein
MSTPRDEQLEDFRGLRERVLRKPENFGAFLGELHRFLHDRYEAAVRTDDNTAGFEHVLRDLFSAKSIAGWQDFLSPDEQRQFFRNVQDPDARRVIAFWAELDEPLGLW